MKNLLVICLALVIVASVGCGNKTQNDENSTTTQARTAQEVSRADRDFRGDPDPGDWSVIKDPVDGSIIENINVAKFSYTYRDRKFYFNSKENYEAFKKDPDKYMSRVPGNPATRSD